MRTEHIDTAIPTDLEVDQALSEGVSDRLERWGEFHVQIKRQNTIHPDGIYDPRLSRCHWPNILFWIYLISLEQIQECFVTHQDLPILRRAFGIDINPSLPNRIDLLIPLHLWAEGEGVWRECATLLIEYGRTTPGINAEKIVERSRIAWGVSPTIHVSNTASSSKHDSTPTHTIPSNPVATYPIVSHTSTLPLIPSSVPQAVALDLPVAIDSTYHPVPDIETGRHVDHSGLDEFNFDGDLDPPDLYDCDDDTQNSEASTRTRSHAQSRSEDPPHRSKKDLHKRQTPAPSSSLPITLDKSSLPQLTEPSVESSRDDDDANDNVDAPGLEKPPCGRCQSQNVPCEPLLRPNGTIRGDSCALCAKRKQACDRVKPSADRLDTSSVKHRSEMQDFMDHLSQRVEAAQKEIDSEAGGKKKGTRAGRERVSPKWLEQLHGMSESLAGFRDINRALR